MPRHPIRLPLLVPVLVLAACGGDKPAPAQPGGLEEAVQQATAALPPTADGSVEPIRSTDLAARLPDRLVGLAGGERTHQDVGMGGMKLSMATAEYREGAAQIAVTLTDAGGVGSVAPMAAAWAMVDIDRTTSSGYERTSRFDGYKALERVSRDGGRLRTEFSVLVGNRFVLQFKAREVEIDRLKEAAKALDLRALARTAD